MQDYSQLINRDYHFMAKSKFTQKIINNFLDLSVIVVSKAIQCLLQ
jgi:hypothetical protein